MRLTGLLILILTLVCVSGCGLVYAIWNPPTYTGDGSAEASAVLATLPLEQPNRRVSAATRTSFGSADVIDASELAEYVDGEGVYMEGAVRNYIILGTMLDAVTPQRLDVFGFYENLWVAVADFETGSWNWIGNGLASGAFLDVPASAVAPDGRFYVLLLAPGEFDYAYSTTVALVTDDPAASDAEPPVWIDEEGIISAQGDIPLSIEYGLAEDSGTTPEPVAHVLYAAPAFAGIDWNRPLELFFDDGSGSHDAEYFSYGLDKAVAVRAMDANGNLTQNENTVTAPAVDDGEPGPEPVGALWSAGDSIVLRWNDPQNDYGIGVLKAAMEGDPEFPDPALPFVVSRESSESGEAEEWVGILDGAPEGVYRVEVRGEPGTFLLELRRGDGSIEPLGEFEFDFTGASEIAYLFKRH